MTSAERRRQIIRKLYVDEAVFRSVEVCPPNVEHPDGNVVRGSQRGAMCDGGLYGCQIWRLGEVTIVVLVPNSAAELLGHPPGT